LRSVVLATAALWAGLGHPADAVAAQPPPPSAARVYLVGDAGDPDPRGEPVLRALRAEVERGAGEVLVAFLGDNVYPAGIPGEAHPRRAEMERRLRALIDAVQGTRARLVLVPGNHDWDAGGEDGWEAVRRQQRLVAGWTGSPGAYLPRDGCPGPEVLDFAERLRLVAVDTQWWLHGGPRPQHPSSACEADSEEEVLSGMAAALAGAGGREVLIAGHHPPDTASEHGGHFGWEDHVFPLRRFKRWLLVPLPLIGSAYPLARQAGIADQDLPSRAYGSMVEAFDRVMRPHRPMAWAGGHDHNLQLLRRESVRHVIVSGAGIFGHTQPVRRTPALAFGSKEAGFVRIDIPPTGPFRFTALGVARSGPVRALFSTDLE
jgi:hypothetical protein